MTITATHRQITIQGLKTHFMEVGNGKKPVIFLHGWGGSTTSFLALSEKLRLLRPDLKMILVDYPGFGLTELETDANWDTYRYGEWVYDFMTTLNLPQADFYIHSFGGRIITRLCEKHPNIVGKIVWTGSAGVKWPLSLRQKISVWLSRRIPKFKHRRLKRLQKFVVTKVFGARDWGNVDPHLKQTLSTVLNEADTRELLSGIENPSLLIWGAKDAITPLKSGRVFAEKLPNAELKVLKTGRHGIHHTHTAEIAEMVAQFI